MIGQTPWWDAVTFSEVKYSYFAITRKWKRIENQTILTRMKISLPVACYNKLRVMVESHGCHGRHSCGGTRCLIKIRFYPFHRLKIINHKFSINILIGFGCNSTQVSVWTATDLLDELGRLIFLVTSEFVEERLTFINITNSDNAVHRTIDLKLQRFFEKI